MQEPTFNEPVELGGWRTLSMVERYSHLSPDHLRAAVERLVPASQQVPGAAELSRNFTEQAVRDRAPARDAPQVCETEHTEG